jgi:hypothetical protein
MGDIQLLYSDIVSATMYDFGNFHDRESRSGRSSYNKTDLEADG